MNVRIWKIGEWSKGNGEWSKCNGTGTFSKLEKSLYRSSHPTAFCKEGVLKNFAKFTGKHLLQRIFLNKGCRPQVCHFIEKETLTQAFSCELCEVFKSVFFYRTPPVTASICKNPEKIFKEKWFFHFFADKRRDVYNINVICTLALYNRRFSSNNFELHAIDV